MNGKKQFRNLLLHTISRAATTALAIAFLLGLTAVLSQSARARTLPTNGGWPEKVMHNFGQGADGVYPSSGLVFDAAGNLYGKEDFDKAYGQFYRAGRPAA